MTADNDTPSQAPRDPAHVILIDHVLIRDRNSRRVLVNQRDRPQAAENKSPDE